MEEIGDTLTKIIEGLGGDEDYEALIQASSACVRDPSTQKEDRITCLLIMCRALINVQRYSVAKEIVTSQILHLVSCEQDIETYISAQLLLCHCRIKLETYSENLVRCVEDVVGQALTLGPTESVYWTAVYTRNAMYFQYNMGGVAVACAEPMLELAEQHKDISSCCDFMEGFAMYYCSERQFAKAMYYYRLLEKKKHPAVYARLCMHLHAPRLAVEVLPDSEFLAQARRAVVDQKYARVFVTGKERVCAQCYAVGERYRKCPCLMARYCSTKCQLEDWPAHSLTCTRKKERLCVVCHKGGCENMCRCKCVFYCSKECQLQDWPSHKHVCATWEK